VKIPFTVDRAWSGEEALHFTVVVRDPERRTHHEWTELAPITARLSALLREEEVERLSYATRRLESEQHARVRGPGTPAGSSTQPTRGASRSGG
jgi:hypothetical protein